MVICLDKATKGDNSMEKCKRIGCNEAVSGKSLYCSGACKTAHNRHSNKPEPTQIEPTHVEIATDTPQPTQPTQAPILAARTNPDRLNYGDHMSSEQLADAGLAANRIPIPGDDDYDGCCTLIDGKWLAPRQVAV
jgi:hypothetical protein